MTVTGSELSVSRALVQTVVYDVGQQVHREVEVILSVLTRKAAIFLKVNI